MSPTACNPMHPSFITSRGLHCTRVLDQLQLLTLLSKHAQIRGMILELRHKSLHVRQDTLDRSLHVQSKLTRWTNDVHDAVTGEHTDDEDQTEHVAAGQPGDDRMVPLHHSLLLVLQHESTIALNRPLLAKTPRTSASQAALEACIGASRGILETVANQELSHAGPAPPAALLVWPLLTWSVWMSCFILSYAALEGVTSISSALRSVEIRNQANLERYLPLTNSNGTDMRGGRFGSLASSPNEAHRGPILVPRQ